MLLHDHISNRPVDGLDGAEVALAVLIGEVRGRDVVGAMGKGVEHCIPEGGVRERRGQGAERSDRFLLAGLDLRRILEGR